MKTVRVGVNARVYFDLEVEDTSDVAINKALDKLNGEVPHPYDLGDIATPTLAVLIDEDREIPEP